MSWTQVLGDPALRASSASQSAAATPDGSTIVWLSSVRLERLTRSDRRSCSTDGWRDATRTVAISPDGRFIACGGTGGVVLVDAATLDTVHRIAEPAVCLAFSPDGQLLACASKAVTLVDVQTGTVKHVLKGSRRFLASIAFDAAGGRIACGGDSKLRVFDAARGKKLVELDDPTRTLVAWTERRLVAMGGDGTFAVWDLETKTSRVIETGIRRTVALARRDATRLWFGTAYDVREPAIVGVLDTTRGEVVARAPLATGREVRALLPTGDAVRVHTDVGVVLEQFTGDALEPLPRTDHTARIVWIVESPGGELLTTLDGNGVAVLWDVKSGAQRARIEVRDKVFVGVAGRESLNTAAFSDDGARLAIGTMSGKIAIVDVARGEVERLFRAHEVGEIQALAFSPDATCIASFNARIMHNVPHLAVHRLDGNPVVSLRSAFFGRALWWIDESHVRIATTGAVAVADLRATEVGPFATHRIDRILADGHATSEDGRFVAASDHQIVCVWSTDSLETTFRLDRKDISRLALSHDGTRLAMAGWDRPLSVVSAVDGSTQCEFDAEAPSPSAMTFSRDGSTLWVGLESGLVRCLDLLS